MKIANRINNIEGSKSVAMAQIITDMRNQGEKVISFNIGEPDLSTAQEIIDATKLGLDRGQTRYSLVPGEVNLRDAIAKKVSKSYNLSLTNKNISLSNGSKQVLYSLFQLLCNEGDEVLIPKPYWVSFPESVKLAGAIPVFIDSKNGRLSLNNIENAITNKTKLIIVNSPNNPTGLIESNESYQALLTLCQKNNITIISDEAYETLIFDGKKNSSPAIFDPELKNTLIVQSFSKSFCMTGFRLGYVVANEAFIKEFIKFQSHVCGNMPPFIQSGALKSLEHEDAIVSQMIEIYQERRDLAYTLCKEIFPNTQKPEGAFYLFPELSKEVLKKYNNDVDLSFHILREAKVALLPGSYFGQPNHLRMCFATSSDNIKNGFAAIARVL